ncbi:MAG: hypothetical protein LBL90_03095 [Prevotellaceae bacterium]|jgi:hypothetical protein|nr:hypothetical protein [Prevotellaceae bacterium]
MKLTILPFFLIAFFYTVLSNAQDIPDQKKPTTLSDSIVNRKKYTNESAKMLTYENSFWGIRTYCGRQVLSNKSTRNFLQSDPDMLRKYDIGRRTLIVGDVFAVAGVLTLGSGLFATVNAYNNNYGFDLDDRILGYSLIGAGSLALAGGILLFFNGQKKMKLAIDAYNDDLLTASFQFGLTPNGIGLLVQF